MGVYKDKKRSWWHVRFEHQGSLYRKAGFKTRTDAIRWEAKKREELGAPTIETPSISFQELATNYLAYCKLRMQRNTIGQKAFVYRSFLASINQDPPAITITKKQIFEYIENRAAAGGNIVANRDLRDLKALYNWAIKTEVDNGAIIKNPCIGISPLPEEVSVPYVPPPEDIIRVIMAADRDERDFIECLYHLLARRSEIMRLTWEDINFEQRWAKLHTRKRKGGALEAQIKPMDNTVYELLLNRFKRRDKSSSYVFQYKISQLDHMMERLCKKAGVKEFGHHAIRHHVASLLRDVGKSTKHIQILLGHKREATTEIYLHVLPEGLRESVGALDQKPTTTYNLEKTNNGDN